MPVACGVAYHSFRHPPLLAWGSACFHIRALIFWLYAYMLQAGSKTIYFAAARYRTLALCIVLDLQASLTL